MLFLTRWVMLIFCLFTFSSLQAQTPSMYKGGGTASNTIPLNTATVLKAQNIYLPGDLVGAASGSISRIFLRSPMVSTNVTLANFTIKIGQTTATNYSGNGLTFFTGLTTVYTSASQTITTSSTAGNWFYIDLATTYAYDVSKTLIVELSFTAKTSGGISLYSTVASTAPNNKRLHANSVSATNGFATNVWTDMGFGFISPSCIIPTDQATALNLSTPSFSTVTGSFTAASSNPSGYLVVQYPFGATVTPPSDGNVYTVGSTLGLGTIVGNGSATNFTKNGLTQATMFSYYVYAYNSNCIGGPKYNTNSPLTGNTTTLSCTPTNQATSLILTPTSAASMSGSFTVALGNPHGYLVVQYPNGAVETPPTDGTSYALSASIGLGTVVSVGSATSFTKNGLTGGTSYDYYVYAYNSTGCVPGPLYKINNPLIGNATTLSCTPAYQASNLVLTPMTTSTISGTFNGAIGNPHGYLVVQYPSGATETPPVNGTSYTLSASLGLGTIVSVGTATSFTKNGLSGGTTYDYYVYAYNSTGCIPGPIYKSNNPLIGNATTLSCTPSYQATNLVLTPLTTSPTISGTFNGATGNPEGYLVVQYPSGAAVTPPVNGTTYVTSSNLGLGIVVSSGNSGNFSVTGLTANTSYDFYVYSFNSSGCSSGPIYNTVNPAFGNATTLSCYGSINLSLTSFPSSICSGQEVIVQATGADSYVWQPSGSTLDFVSDFPSTTTTYTVTGTSIINGCTFTQTKTHTVNVTQTPVFYVSRIGSICPGGQSTLIALGGSYNYAWQPSVGILSTYNDSLFVTLNSTTTFTINAYNGACTYSDIYTAYVEDPVTINASATTTGYCNNPVTLTGGGMSSYMWQPGGATTASISVSPSATTTYTVTGTSSLNCVTTKTKLVTVPPPIQTTATSTSVCVGGTTNLSATNVSSDTGAFTSNIPFNIPAYGYVSQQLTVSGLPTNGAQLKSVVLNNLYHAAVEDIIVSLTSPSGQSYGLIGFNSSGTFNANITLQDGFPPLPSFGYPTGTYGPLNPLSNYTGNMNGNWTININDTWWPNSGSLDSWQLIFEYPNIQWTSSTTPVNTPNLLTTTASVPSTTTYTATVTDAFGCTATNTVTVNVTPCPVACTVNLLLQGYYLSGLAMQPVLMNQGRGSSSAITDTVEVNLYHPSTHALVATSRVPVATNGTISPSFNVLYGNYYISVKHRNSIEVWSAAPIYLSATQTNYIFYNQASSAYGSNQVEVAPGKWALYSGDLNQDGFIDSFDYPTLDADIYNGISAAYVATDLNGDGFVDSFDYPIFDANSSIGVSTIAPW